jgi:hypothetical protein
VTTLAPIYSAYRKYVEGEDCYDLRSEEDKKKYGKKLVIKRKFPVLLNNYPTFSTSKGFVLHISCL